MNISDPIADMLTRIRNAQLVGQLDVRMPASGLKAAIAQVLKDEGYIEDFAVRDEGIKRELRIGLKYYAGRPVIERLERINRTLQLIPPENLEGSNVMLRPVKVLFITPSQPIERIAEDLASADVAILTGDITNFGDPPDAFAVVEAADKIELQPQVRKARERLADACDALAASFFCGALVYFFMPDFVVGRWDDVGFLAWSLASGGALFWYRRRHG